MTKHLRIGKLNRGQSLVEMALSVTFLVLMFSGAVDLGRAYFTQVALNNAISEAAHYLSIFPDCAAKSELNSLSVGTTNPHCEGTNSALSRLMNESDNLNSTFISDLTISVVNPVANVNDDPPKVYPSTGDTDEYKLTVAYKMPLLTPFMRAMFGDSLTLYASNNQVARTSITPVPTGIAISNAVQLVPNGSCSPGGNISLPYSLSPNASSFASANGLAVLKDDGSGTILDTVWLSPPTGSSSFVSTVGGLSAGYYYLIPVTGTNSGGKVSNPVQLSGSYRSSDWHC